MSSQPARAVVWRDQYRVIVDGKLFALDFPSMSEAQEFADLCNRKERMKDIPSFTQTITHNNRTFTPSEWSDWLSGKTQ